MKYIKDKNDLPYSLDLIEEVAAVKLSDYNGNGKDDPLTLFEIVIICNWIAGIAHVDDYYILSPNACDTFNLLLKYGIDTHSYTYAEFYERRQNRLKKHKLGEFDTRLGDTPIYYCEQKFYELLNKQL